MKAFFSKHKKKIIWSVSLIVLLLVILFVYLKISATLHFTLQTEILTTHKPTQLVLDTTNNATVVVNLETTVNTFRACDSICDYSVAEIYSLSNQSSKKLTHTFSINTPARGFGQQLYHFKSSCRTIADTFCPSSGQIINQTSLIVVNYNLQEDEQKIVNDIEIINSTLIAATKQVEQLRYAKQLYTLWPQTDISILDDKELTTKITAFTKAWKQEDYLLANELLSEIKKSLHNITSVPILISNIETYNTLQTEINNVLSNETVKEYIAYAQKYDENAGTARQAVNRLTAIYSTNFIEDLPRAQSIVKGATQYLENKTESYVDSKAQALEIIAFARTLLPLIQTQLTTVPQSTCGAINSLLEHNSWVHTSNITQINETVARTIVQPVNSTFIFNVPTQFCIESQVNVPIDVELASVNKIKLPILIELNSPNIEIPTANCQVDGFNIECYSNRPPVLFIHGHSFDESNSPQISMIAFSRLQERLEKEGYVNAGELVTQTQSKILPPITIRASYYYIQQFGVGDYSFEIQKSERIENYAIRLKEIIDDVKRLSGSQNVTLVAHSMGGLVAREYASLFGMGSLDQVITINTPHQGITGRIVSICSLLGAAKECEDMTTNSTFLRRLPPITGEWDVIASTGCQMKDGVGDGVVLVGNSLLPGSKYHLINGTCTDALESDLHTTALDDERVYELVVSILSND